MEKAVLRLHDVHKTYFLDGVEVRALRGVTLDIRKGDFLAITGASGSGKSTLLNVIGCLDSPTSGRVEINGVDTATLDDDRLARMRGKEIGFVFQSFNLQPNMTVWENVALAMRIHEYPEEEVTETVTRLLADVGLSDRIGHYPNQLSGGQQQRVAIARALSTNPAIILADEPTGNLDSESGGHIMELLARINKEDKVTVVVVTHEPTVVSYARRKVHVKDGKINA
jgi:putative ABC transport system ATP-binding protein